MDNSMEFIELQQLKTRIDVLNRKLEGQKLLNDRIISLVLIRRRSCYGGSQSERAPGPSCRGRAR